MQGVVCVVGLLWHCDLYVEGIMYLCSCNMINIESCYMCICCRVGKDVVSPGGRVGATCSTCIVACLLLPSCCLCSNINDGVAVESLL